MKKLPTLLALTMLLAALMPYARAQSADAPAVPAAQKAVLITGASSGLGRAMAEKLASEGYFVYAGARKQSDLDELSAIDNIQGVRLDVTVQKDIDDAVALVRERGRGLYGLVNNEGVAVIGPLIEVDEQDMQFLMDVNLFGPYRVTKAFAPLIIESKGRIVTTGSISGILSGPFYGPYSMSKHAMEAFTDSLAREMQKFDVAVSIIEPGNYRSEIGDARRARMKRRGQTTEGSLYKAEFDRRAASAHDDSEDGDPAEVADALLRILSDPAPQLRYLVVPNEREAGWTINKALHEVAELNQNQRFHYDRDTLIEMLDGALDDASR